MNSYKVTLTFSLTPFTAFSYWTQQPTDEKLDAFMRTDRFYESTNIIDYIKSHNALDMVEWATCSGEVVKAEWDKNLFQMYVYVKTDDTLDILRVDLQTNSLEDGEYEACGETGWILFTRGSNGEVYDGDCEENAWQYAIVDYRNNPILIESVSS